jgi:hypothetical protein
MMQLRMTVKPGVYQKLRKLYGRHVDSIQLHTRPIRGTTTNEYSATCDEHGVIVEWCKDITQRTQEVQVHLKGLHD